MKVMFVCTGNICRSPMAEVIFKDLVGDAEVSSAGTFAMDGQNASYHAIDVCKKYGLDLSGHKSTPIDESDIEQMDLVLTATVNHRDELRASYPQLNIYAIKEYAGYDDWDIADPYGYNIHVYENCFLEIKDALEKIRDIEFDSRKFKVI